MILHRDLINPGTPDEAIVTRDERGKVLSVDYAFSVVVRVMLKIIDYVRRQ